MSPLTALEANQTLADVIRITSLAGRSPVEIVTVADELVSSWPADLRPDRASVDKLLTFYGRKPLSIEAAPPRPAKGRKLDADVPDGSEAALAEFLAKTDSCHRLRYSSAMNAGGPYQWTDTHWQVTTDRAPLPLQVAVRRALADGIEAK